MANATSTPIAMATTTLSEVIVSVTHDPDETDDGSLVSGIAVHIITVMNFGFVLLFIEIFGTVSNIINVIIFFKMGFNESVNISLFALAITDLCGCVSLFWMSICWNPGLETLDLSFIPREIQYLQAGWPHNIFTRITMCITAFITFERCLCVVVPLKVKRIITPKRVKIFIVSIYVIILASVAPVYYYTRHGWKFDASKNRSLLGIVFTDDRDVIEPITFAISSVAIPIIVFVLIVVFTSILTVSLKRKTKWRAEAAGATSSDRDVKLSKMVVAISVLFIICFIPIFVSLLAMAIEPEFSIIGRYKNLNFIIFSYHFILDTGNSALNIFIYYRMSSNYRATFDKLFRRYKDSKGAGVFQN